MVLGRDESIGEHDMTTVSDMDYPCPAGHRLIRQQTTGDLRSRRSA